MSDGSSSAEKVDADLAAFEDWINAKDGEVGYHYSLGDSIGASMQEDYRTLMIQMLTEGIDPVTAAKQSLASVVSFGFQLGYDFARQTNHQLDECRCSKTSVAKEVEDETPKKDDTPGMYL